MATRARERLLDAAEDLFYAEGIRAVGLERILTVSGVGRASFYRHFASKEDLVVAVLERRDRTWRASLAAGVAAAGGDPLDVFDVLAERFDKADFRGCAFINSMIESADPASAIHAVAAAHKTALTAYIGELLSARGLSPDLAPQFVMLMDGATVTALRDRTTAPAHQAKQMAELLLTR
ncbi:TetR/AcrR family transcriptional regulator [Hamadaea tsunoensis]|uniref:TetR/AcrR family transcriptional regulator n=1 Tax=Hamadaea tsunoensis TaxID=53368 RepID=UPI000425B79A|nr:TetR/AcrR family transcriptional regulator [Hamadaea tsunoensis]